MVVDMTKYTEEKIDVLIRNNETNEIVVHEDDGYFDEYGLFQDFIWSDGNYACDCNRAKFFCDANGIDRLEYSGCSDYKYSVKIIRKSNGEVLYDEFD